MSGPIQPLMRTLKHRLLSLALIALLVQATLPYLITNCPVYTVTATQISGHAAMPADCPMLALKAKAPAPTDKPQNTALTCPLCAVMSPLHSFVMAGLIALPPPQVLVINSLFSSKFSQISILPTTAAFSARGPPVTV